MTDDAGLLFLLQVTSAAFPSGTYAHSSGFETLLDEDTVNDAESLRLHADEWLEGSIAPTEGVALLLAHDAQRRNDLGTLIEIDQALGAMKTSREAFESSFTTGRATLRTIDESFGCRNDQYSAAVREERAAGHVAVTFGVCAQAHGVQRQTALTSYLFTAYANVISVVGRLSPLGQRDVQSLLARSNDLIRRCEVRASSLRLAEMYSVTTYLDIASMRHERLTTRLCIS